MEEELRCAEQLKCDRELIPNELSFDFLGLGISDEVTIIKDDGNQLLQKNTSPLGPPPVLPSLREEIEHHLLTPEAVPIHAFQKSQKFWEEERNVENLFDVAPLPSQLVIQMERNPRTGEVENMKEIKNSNDGLTAQNSMSLKRKPGENYDSVKGESSHQPFCPGGMDLPVLEKLIGETENSNDILQDGLLSCAPGFSTSISFEKKTNMNTLGSFNISKANVSDILLGDVELSDLFVDVSQQATSSESPVDVTYSVPDTDIPDGMLKVEVENNNLEGVKKAKVVAEEVWGVLDDFTDTKQFHREIPDMAFKYPFELDVFQKRAILHLERHDNVLVAAHTSAGKTVVAEYAIALAQKHMQRAIYTSPIKALSNQKFRDFKSTFPEVGLLTGDVQIKPESSCLIMTTEILRSMLYNGSDVIRDLEWVIFDEIHYINDVDRGVVWEEVLIMLPAHVGIVLLSATVPNTVEFASWIGKTKKNKVFVVQTRKRPVPLEHYLYTGNSNKTSDELFLILDRNGKFVVEGYRAALIAKKERASKANEQYGPKGVRQGNPKQDRNIWLSVVQMLKKKEQLPVVAFTLSKRKCDSNADMLRNVDLITATERSHIISFFNKSVSRLKGSDRSLPQVLWMEELLKVGVGVHHSGILPILKEVVEMLFQRGHVKLLFATETFAMGVNMPARTVVFDSTRKFDGNEYRDLLSSEYIQMAGRAGRRGLDTTGMVVLLCKGDVPETSDLHRMMLGTPTRLVSQFRLTYYMILNLLRVKQLTVQDMMKRSFAEFFLQKDAPENQKKLDELKAKVKLLKEPECGLCAVDLKAYYLNWAEILQLKKEIQCTMFSSLSVLKTMQPGRLILVSNEHHKNSLAVVLLAGGIGSSNKNPNKNSDISNSPLSKLYTVLILCDSELEESRRLHSDDNRDDKKTFNNYSENFLSKTLYQPVGKPSQVAEEIVAAYVTHIIDRKMKCDTEKIIENHKKRLIPRFRLDPPSETTIRAGQELYNLSVEFSSNGCPILDPIKGFNINDIDFVRKCRLLQIAESKASSFDCLQCDRFEEHFSVVRSNVKLEEDVRDLEMKLSDESLELISEYHQRIEVLKALNYIDAEKNLRHKGRVAFEINTHEVMITELLINNILTDLHPAEIVAILSCFVFEMKNTSKPNLTDNLQKVVDEVKRTAERVAVTQKQCGMDVTVESFLEQLHFGLVEVVYEWGCGMPFVKITELTDVSEGNIVRCIQRLDETCRDVKKAAHVIGVQALCDKMEEGMSLIRRDIVFAASLYTS